MGGHAPVPHQSGLQHQCEILGGFGAALQNIRKGTGNKLEPFLGCSRVAPVTGHGFTGKADRTADKLIKQNFLGCKIMIQKPGADARFLGDAGNIRCRQPVMGEEQQGSIEDFLAGSFFDLTVLVVCAWDKEGPFSLIEY